MSKGDIFLENDFFNNFHKLEYKIFSISFENNLEEYVKWKTVTNSSHVEKLRQFWKFRIFAKAFDSL